MDLNSVDTKITVGGAPCDFRKMHLHQSMTGHHTFEIEVNFRHHDKSAWAVTADNIFKEALGKPVGIVMKHIVTGETNEFSGFITDVKVVGWGGDQGTAVLKGGSPTILLDRDPSMRSFMDYMLSNVVAETIGESGVPISLENKPKSQRIIPYLARYGESSWAFLSRVLYSFGEWFYYDGKKLVVGSPAGGGTRVCYDMELLEVGSGSNVNDLNTQYYDHNPTDNYYYEEESPEPSASYAMKLAKSASDPFYPTVATLPVGREVLSEGDMTEVVRAKKNRQYAGMVEFTAKCSSCAVRIGEIATATIASNLPDVELLDFGSFRVLEVDHYADMDKRYHNTFKGMSAQAETVPAYHIAMPNAFQEPAIVIDNDDPKKKGRVKVRLRWQTSDKSTNWIQVQTPDAGSSGAVPKNRGFFFIPEIGDQVLVAFLHGDPSRPYVAGSLYHRDITKGAAKENIIKTIITRSGHTIEFNDDEKAEDWGITIKDKGGNFIHLHTAGKNIEITAPETMTLNAKNIYIRATEDMGLSSGENTTQSVGKDFSQSVSGRAQATVNRTYDRTVGEDASLTVARNLKQTVTGKVSQRAEAVKIKAEGGQVNISAPDVITVKSNKEVIIAQ